jgi:hypothetical protein
MASRETATSVKAASAERRRGSETVLEGLERAVVGVERIRAATREAVDRGIFPAEARGEAVELFRRAELAARDAAAALEEKT